MEELVADAAAKGARVLCGGVVPEGTGWYYPPTVLAGITPEMRVHTEEVFGPVATLYRVADIDEAIELANGTEFGLGANAWTDDEQERARFVRDLDAGMVFINGNVTSYPQLPFGGVKPPATAANWRRKAFASSATSSRCGSAARPAADSAADRGEPGTVGPGRDVLCRREDLR